MPSPEKRDPTSLISPSEALTEQTAVTDSHTATAVFGIARKTVNLSPLASCNFFRLTPAARDIITAEGASESTRLPSTSSTCQGLTAKNTMLASLTAAILSEPVISPLSARGFSSSALRRVICMRYSAINPALIIPSASAEPSFPPPMIANFPDSMFLFFRDFYLSVHIWQIVCSFAVRTPKQASSQGQHYMLSALPLKSGTSTCDQFSPVLMR